MPPKSKPLGFTCRCGRDYGSKQKLTIYNNKRSNEEYSKKRVLSKRNEVGRINPHQTLPLSLLNMLSIIKYELMRMKHT